MVREDLSGALPALELTLAIDEVPAARVAELRARLGDALQACDPPTLAFACDAQLARFIRADGGDLEKAEGRARETLRWRVKFGAHSAVCRACLRVSPRSHYMHHIGFDRHGRAVIYSCHRWAMNSVVQDNMEHLVQVFESISAAMEGTKAERCVWVMDFQGFAMRHMGIKMGTTATKIMSRYYPERLGLGLIIEAPGLFSGLWRVMEPLLDRATRQKVRFLPGPQAKGKRGERLRSVLEENFDEELVEWLLEEMRQNRAKEQPRRAHSAAGVVDARFGDAKCWQWASAHAQGALHAESHRSIGGAWPKPPGRYEGALPPSWARDASGRAHDPRGPPSFVRRLRTDGREVTAVYCQPAEASIDDDEDVFHDALEALPHDS